jgi:hypothetical protein
MDPAGGWAVTLSTSPATLWPTQFSTLTATANADVGPTPYYIRIYDMSDGQYVANCSAGTTCSLGVTEPTGGTQQYVAVISGSTGGAFPPFSGAVASSAYEFVTWQNVTVTLVDSPSTVPDGGFTELQADASADVGPSPFYIYIFDAKTGFQIAMCPTGNVCPGNGEIGYRSLGDGTKEFVAYVAGYSTSFPPPNIQSTSYGFTTWTSSTWNVSLSGPTAVTHGNSATYTATANSDVGPTPYYIEIFDATTGTRLWVCGIGTTCSVSFQPNDAGDDLVAFVSSLSTALPPANTLASSSTLHVNSVSPV